MRLCNSLRLGIYFYVTCCLPLYLAFARDTGLAEDNDQSSPGRQLLAGPNFRISARTSMLKPGGYFSLSEEIVTEEFYSNSQKRALVQLHRDDYDDIPHSVYHYQDSRIVRNSLHDRKKCDAIIEDELTKELFGKLLIAKDWLKKRVAVPDYVIGLARLLFIVDYHRHALIKTSEMQSVMIRNHKTLRYELPTTAEDSFGLEGGLRIYYAETEDHFGGFDLPIRIIFQDANFGQLVVDYSFVGAVDEDIIEHSVDNLSPLDFFALPVGNNCSGNLPSARDSGWSIKRIQVASFQAEIFKHNWLGTEQTTMSKRFVAYDSYAGAMRSDAMTSTSYSITILDFSASRKYNILSSRTEDAENIRECVATKVINSGPYLRFLPFEELIYIGQAIVRGVDCYAFEHITKQLPPVLFPLLVHTNLDGKEEAIFEIDSDTHSVVFYFGANLEQKAKQKQLVQMNLPPGPLMRIDVYCEGRLQYHIDILNFVNQLEDAPNGDQQEELFAVKDRCTSGDLDAYGYASLSLEMVYRPKSETPKTPHEMMAIFTSQHLRNKSVLRALAKVAAGTVTKLSDLETRMRLSSSGELTFYLGAQLDVPDIGVTEVRQVGWSSVKLPSSEIKTIEECFQLAAHAQSASNAVLFVSCANSCTFDTAPNIEYESDGETIKSITSYIYKPDPKRSQLSSCPTMLIDPVRRRQTETSLTALHQTFLWLHSGLGGKTLPVLMPHDGDCDAVNNDMLFEVTKVDISNDKWSTALGYEKAHQDDTLRAAAIDGLGLTVTNGQLQVPRQRKASPEEEPTMSYQICHSICMANMSCRSFSICITRRGVECITSEVDFRDESFLRQIDEQVNTAKTQSKDESPKSKTITVPSPKRMKQSKDDNLDGEWEEPGAGYEQIELKIDFRCKLYKKNVLEMFRKLSPTKLAFMNSDLRPVRSHEHCAEICVQNNIVFFKKMAQTRLELSRNDQEVLNDEELVKRIRDEYNTNLMGWCSTFHYLDSSSSNIDNEAKAYIEPKILSDTGLCLTARSKLISQKPSETDDTTAGAETTGPRIIFESFQLLYSNLFDIQYGISLVAADKDDQGKPLPMINKSLREYAPSAESCAQRCFLQTSGLNLWCKSFDFVESRKRDSKAKYPKPVIVSKYCLYHSSSLVEIRSNGMVKFMVTDLAAENYDTSLDIQSWHYDSRESYTLEDAVLSKMVLVKSETTLVDEIHSYRLHTLGIMAILLTAMLLSTAVVYLHGESMVNKFSATRRDSISHPPRSFLSSLVPGSVPSSSSSVGSATITGSSLRHKRFVAGDQELPDIPELSSI